MTPEGIIQKYLIEQIRAAGGYARRAQWIGVNGCPDVFIYRPKEKKGLDTKIPACAFVEVKAPGMNPRANQEREIGRLEACGIKVFVIDNLEGAEIAVRHVVNISKGYDLYG